MSNTVQYDNLIRCALQIQGQLISYGWEEWSGKTVSLPEQRCYCACSEGQLGLSVGKRKSGCSKVEKSRLSKTRGLAYAQKQASVWSRTWKEIWRGSESIRYTWRSLENGKACPWSCLGSYLAGGGLNPQICTTGRGWSGSSAMERVGCGWTQTQGNHACHL